MRTASIKALLDRSKQDLKKIEGEYEKSLHDRMIDPNLRIDIKNLCENLRSVLDYLARDIREKYCPSASIGERFYFPIFPDGTQFKAQMSRWFPNIEVASPDLYSYLESIQPYKSGGWTLGVRLSVVHLVSPSPSGSRLEGLILGDTIRRSLKRIATLLFAAASRILAVPCSTANITPPRLFPSLLQTHRH